MAEQIVQPGFQRLAAKGDAGQRIVDLVGHAGRQEADAGQPFGANQLPAALVDLTGQVAVQILQTLHHVVEGGAEFFHLVAAVHLDAVIEIAPGDADDAAFQIADGVKNPGVEGAEQADYQQQTHDAGRDGDPQRDLIIAPRTINALVDVIVDVVAQRARILADPVQQLGPFLALGAVDLCIVLHESHVYFQRQRILAAGLLAQLLAELLQVRAQVLANEVKQFLRARLRFMIAVEQIGLAFRQIFASLLDRLFRRCRRFFPNLCRIAVFFFGQERRQFAFVRGFMLLAGWQRQPRRLALLSPLHLDQGLDVADGGLTFLGLVQQGGHVAEAFHVEIVRPDAEDGAAQQQDHGRDDQAQTEHQFVANAPSRGHARTLLPTLAVTATPLPERPCLRSPRHPRLTSSDM